MRLKRSLVMIALAFALAASASADIYKYRTPDGKLVIGNRPPEGVADIEQRFEASPPTTAEPDSMPVRSTPRPAAPTRTRLYVDDHPLAMSGPSVQRTNVWWKRIVTGTIENRSGITRTENVMVKATCQAGSGVETGSDYLSVVPPRSRATYTITIILTGFDEDPGAVFCSARMTWTNIF